MSSYEKQVSMAREEEGTYHRREYEHAPAQPQTTHYTTKTYRQLVPTKPDRHTSDDDDQDQDRYEEWTTSKRKVNHKTRQVETRVSRQLLVEDGKVIADSGPQVTTRITEDNKVEECEKEKTPKHKGRFEALEGAPECAGDASGRVLGEKKEIKRVSREVREENMQYHDERFKELTGQDVHRRAIQAPHELITITDGKHADSAPRGKMVHYSNKGKKYQDTDEILEVAKLAIDGSITKEVKRTKHHEEFSEDEKPDETGEAEALREAPIATRSGRRHVDYVNDFDDTATPSSSDNDEPRAGHAAAKTGGSARRHRPPGSAGRPHRKHSREEEAAFPRYEVDPLLNSLRDEDFRPATSYAAGSPTARGQPSRVVRVGSRNRSHSSSDDDQDGGRPARRRASPQASRQPAVEIPEEYRVNKQRLMGKSAAGGSRASLRERSFSPPHSRLSHKSSKSHRSHKEDASVQAHLTDEEEERKSVVSLSSTNSHGKTTRHLQRQSTANSSRNYYFGEPKGRRTNKGQTRRRGSVSSQSSLASSLSDPKEQARRQGVRSRDSGFKSPHSQQIYSVSSKSRSGSAGRRAQQVSPAPTCDSAGQRSVKTTTTTVSAGLADRPLSRQEAACEPPRARSPRDRSAERSAKPIPLTSYAKSTRKPAQQRQARPSDGRSQPRDSYSSDGDGRRSFDNVSLSSLGPNATTIKVPYKRIEIEYEASEEEAAGADQLQKQQQQQQQQHQHRQRLSPVEGSSRPQARGNKTVVRTVNRADSQSVQESSSEMSLQEDIASLSKRLEKINRDTSKLRHFDYKTVVANCQPAPIAPKQQIVDAYNVRVIEHKSPFHNDQQPLRSISDLSDSIARLELQPTQQRQGDTTATGLAISDGTGASATNANDNNNEANFNLADFVKYKAVPAMVEPSLTLGDNLDSLSVASSEASLKSSRTYDIRSLGGHEQQQAQQTGDDEPMRHRQPSSDDEETGQPAGPEAAEFDENGHSKRPAAWIFDPRDGSSTAIAPPARPKRPPSPKVDSKTEELVQARGGRSYYLELVDASDRAAKRQRPSSIDSLYSRWNSQGALNGRMGASQTSCNAAVLDSRKARQQRPDPSAGAPSTRRHLATETGANTTTAQQPKQSQIQQLRRQLPSSGPSMGSRSKSSSCLLTGAKPCKYSIYGGFRRPGETNKPVPRLSYSRAIGPKSQRQLDAQSKTPSRYLKLK